MLSLTRAGAVEAKPDGLINQIPINSRNTMGLDRVAYHHSKDGVNPPSGVWQDDSPNNDDPLHMAGYAIMREMEGRGSGGSKQTPAKNPDAPVTKGELGNEIKRIMSEHLPTILAQSQENFRKAEEARKAAEDAEKKKKVNEEAERRRKAMEDKRAAEEQERKAEQARKNAEDAERLRIEEAERRRNTEAQRDGCTYKAFLNCNPAEFHGESDPGKYASHLAEREARHWWAKVSRIARGLMDKLEEEFLKLQQNDMTAGIGGPVSTSTTLNPIFQEAVELALMVEKENNRQLEEGGDNKRKRENCDDDMKKIKISGEKTDNASECKKPGHKIVDCPERNPQEPQEKTGYSGNRVEYKDTSNHGSILSVEELFIDGREYA
ncbi:hypothetical protein Tco_0725755 [Tanacetum coccineum]|uniref:Uncharacterized protein n=1 Tax=Tanacetum coccineum TaxID=301880 RepID=A0ABQ4YDT9_9ASTR